MSNSLPVAETTNHQPNEAPINRLFPEIINYIFSLCIDEEDRSDGDAVRLCLSWVCQLWRHVIINNTSFWTTIDYWNNPDLVATFIMRSQDRKLRIQLWDVAFEYPQKVAQIKSTLISEASRIEYIDAELSSLNLKSIEEVLCRPFPSLRHLSFCQEYNDKLPLINSHIPFTLDISKLEVLEMGHSSSVPWNCLQAVISKVRKLRINFDRPESVVNFFDSTQSFDGLEILSIKCNLGNLPQIPTITLPNITGLLIEGGAPSIRLPWQTNLNPPTPFSANHLHVPNLRHLVMFDNKEYPSISHPDFDYASIQYISLITILSPGSTDSYSFCITGSAKKVKLRDDWLRLLYAESFLSDSSLDKQFQLMATHFYNEQVGFIKSIAVLNELLPKMPGVRELCLPSSPYLKRRLFYTPLHPDLMKRYPSLIGFRLICRTSDMHVYGR